MFNSVVLQTFDSCFIFYSVAAGSECDNSNGGCQQICVNRTGLITCYCNQGYNLTNDRKTCQGILIFLEFIYVFDKKFVLGGTESDCQIGAMVTLSLVT